MPFSDRSTGNFFMRELNSNQSGGGGEIKERTSGEERDSWVTGIRVTMKG